MGLDPGDDDDLPLGPGTHMGQEGPDIRPGMYPGTKRYCDAKAMMGVLENAIWGGMENAIGIAAGGIIDEGGADAGEFGGGGTWEEPSSPTVIEGHGLDEGGTFTVPEGTTVWAPDQGLGVSESAGQGIATGNYPPEGMTMYSGGDEMPDYTVYPPGDTVIPQPGSITVTAPTPLSDLIGEGGDYVCSFCTYRPGQGAWHPILTPGGIVFP